MAEPHEVKFSNGKSVQVSADPNSHSYIDDMAQRIVTEVGTNPLRTMMNAGFGVAGLILQRRGMKATQKQLDELNRKLQQRLR